MTTLAPKPRQCTKETKQCLASQCGTRTPQCCRRLLSELFADFCTCAKRHGLTFWLDYGSLLGCVRNSEMIPWDEDIDISVFLADKPAFEKTIDELKKTYFHHHVISAESPLLHRVFVSHTNRLHIDISMRYLCPKLDRWVDKYDGKQYGLSRECLEPLLDAQFEGQPVKIPHLSIKYLEQCYGKNCVSTPRARMSNTLAQILPPFPISEYAKEIKSFRQNKN